VPSSWSNGVKSIDLQMAYKHNLDGFTCLLVCLLTLYENAFATQVPRRPWFKIGGRFAIVNVMGDAGTTFNIVFPAVVAFVDGLTRVVTSSFKLSG